MPTGRVRRHGFSIALDTNDGKNVCSVRRAGKIKWALVLLPAPTASEFGSPWPLGPFFPLSDVRFPNFARRLPWFTLALWVSYPALRHLRDAALDIRFLCTHRFDHISGLATSCLSLW